jgi:hypothetical protein
MPSTEGTKAPPAKQHKKDGKDKDKKEKKKDTDVPMGDGKSGSSGAKRPAVSDSDESEGLGGPPCTPPSSSSPPVTEDMLTRMFNKFTSHIDDKLTSMQELNDGHFVTMSQGFTKSLQTLAERVEANEAASQAKFDTLEASMVLLNDRMKAPPPAAAPSSSWGPAAASSSPTQRAAPAGLDEECLVFIRGFPTTQPGFILKEYAAEALAILPDSDRAAVRLRISPADIQFSMVFPSPEKATSFVTNYRALSFVFYDPNKAAWPLSCRTGKPIALRRRGGLIRPVYTALEEVMGSMESMASATISQSSKMKNGVMTTSFFALRGRSLTPLFYLVFQESPEAMHISGFHTAEECPISASDLTKVRIAALGA